jgi:hypothetical protein
VKPMLVPIEPQGEALQAIRARPRTLKMFSACSRAVPTRFRGGGLCWCGLEPCVRSIFVLPSIAFRFSWVCSPLRSSRVR